MYFNVFTANLQHTHPRMPVHKPSITTTLPLPSNEGCRHCFSLLKEFRQVGLAEKYKGPWNRIPIRCVEQTFLCCTDDVPPATLIVDPIVPRRNRGWGQALPATAPTPQQSTIPHNNRRSTTLISPSIHAHDHQLAVYDPEDHLGSDKPCIDRVVRCQCCINKCDRRALCRRALCRQVTKPIRHDLPNLAGLHGSVN